MTPFKDIVIEMAIDRGNITTSFDRRESDWIYFLQNKQYKLVRDRIGSNHYNVYKCGSTYFLTDDNNKYLGYIEFNIKDSYYIISSSSDLKGGFYSIMFTVILSSGVKEILSDNKLSTNAIKSYDKLNKNTLSFYVSVTDGNTYYEFSKDILLSHPNNRVSIREKHDLNELFLDFYERIEMVENGIPMSYKISYDNRTEKCDWFLFGDMTDLI